MRIGQGFDAHKLVSKDEFLAIYPNRSPKLILGGIQIEHDKFLLGYSDADVLVHAIIDALLGAAGLEDIGAHFPDTDAKYAGIDSMELLKKAFVLLCDKSYKIANIDSTVIAQKPKLRPFIDDMRANIAQALNMPKDNVSVKATTTEHLGFTGREEGIAATAVVLLQKPIF
ncbi:MAG: 2-C-methyl-D-erythritol 2,4-cyclodiphosphate synthase [Candidatus Caenarcaniphilales bacterium]|jgi:2-C-methyl-D-erythritol 2,4-cyclodiphosphate synthase|nr:2-C-methyl-D-erythritol 2,4-cyclodiphosphate synthase [Candidatus Caenarcaniphilales bacterium]